MDATETAHLIERARKGDSGAADRLFSFYLDSLRSRFRRKIEPALWSKLDVEDLLQSSVREALGGLPDFENKGPRAFYRWLSRITDRNLNAKRDHFYAEKRSVRREEPLGHAPESAAVDRDPLADSAPGPPTEAARKERARIVRECVDRLDEPYRSILLLEMDEGKTSAEIGASLEKPASTVRTLRVEARERLKRLLKSRLGGWPPSA